MKAGLILLLVTVGIAGMAQDKLSYLALGDSYTIGESVEESSRWPVQLAARLNKDDIPVGKPAIIARTGWRTDQVYYAAEVIRGEKYDMVSLLTGVNDQYQGKTIEEFEPWFRKALDFAIDHCEVGKEGVFVLSIPDYGVTPFGQKNEQKIGKEIDAYNEVCKRVCKEKEVAFYDITAISRQAKNNPKLIAEDSLHPSKEMYTLWVDEIYSGVKKQIE